MPIPVNGLKISMPLTERPTVLEMSAVTSFAGERSKLKFEFEAEVPINGGVLPPSAEPQNRKAEGH